MIQRNFDVQINEPWGTPMRHAIHVRPKVLIVMQLMQEPAYALVHSMPVYHSIQTFSFNLELAPQKPNDFTTLLPLRVRFDNLYYILEDDEKRYGYLVWREKTLYERIFRKPLYIPDLVINNAPLDVYGT